MIGGTSAVWARTGGALPARAAEPGSGAGTVGQDWPLVSTRTGPGVDDQRSSVPFTFAKQAPDGHGDLPPLVERIGMAGPVVGGQVREERPGEQTIAPSTA